MRWIESARVGGEQARAADVEGAGAVQALQRVGGGARFSARMQGAGGGGAGLRAVKHVRACYAL